MLVDPRVNRIASPATENARGGADAPTAEGAAVNFTCTVCSRVFTTQRGLRVHFRQHPSEANAWIEISSSRKHWKEDEMQIFAKEEARAAIVGVRFLNQHLCRRFNGDLVRV
uniref:C2H2-type domain-containing protein n=1 Tax=Trichogramma kaykai TaxID=54128 RepID=A0ABD2X8Z3_9HYME